MNSAGQICVLLFVLFSISCTSRSESSDTNVKFRQYYVKGEELYLKHCSNCHQSTGTGLGLVYPPLNKSDYMNNNLNKVLCGMKYGLEGEVIVNGKSFIQPMPGIPSLTELEIAEIATYIYNSWEHKKGLIEVNEVSKIVRSCESQ